MESCGLPCFRVRGLPHRYPGLAHCLCHPRLCAAQVEKHWTEKALSDMTERDWRIFREDFNIGYRGVNTVLPIRNWEEAGLPDPLKKVGRLQQHQHSCVRLLSVAAALRGRCKEHQCTDTSAGAQLLPRHTSAWTAPGPKRHACVVRVSQFHARESQVAGSTAR